MLRKWLARSAWMAAGIAALYGVSALAGVVSGGPLDPPGSPSSTYKSFEILPPIWVLKLPSDEGPDACNSRRFTCVMDGEAVLDRETGLVWELSPETCVNACLWANGYTNCVKTGTGGRHGWRMPGIEELQTLIDPVTHELPVGHPFTVGSGTYWSHTAAPADPGFALVLDVTNGLLLVTASDKAVGPGNPWCVRAPGGDDAD